MRGKAFWQHKTPGVPWITPACAGKREIVADSLDRLRDHPRMCGEKYQKFGSSGKMPDHPRMCGEKTKKIP